MPRKIIEEVFLISVEIPQVKGTKKDGRGKMHIRVGKITLPTILTILNCFSVAGCILSVIFCLYKFHHRFPQGWRVVIQVGIILGANIYAWFTFAMLAKFIVSIIKRKRVSESVHYWLLFVGFTTTTATSFYYIYHRLSELWKPIGKISFLLCVNYFIWHAICNLGKCLIHAARKEFIKPECLKHLTILLWDIAFLSTTIFSFYKFYYPYTFFESIYRLVILLIVNACVWIAAFNLGNCLIRAKRREPIKDECLGNLIISLCILCFIVTITFSFQKFYYASFNGRIDSVKVVKIIIANCVAWTFIGVIASRCCLHWGHSPWRDKRIDSKKLQEPSKNIYMDDMDHISEIKHKIANIEARREIVEKSKKPIKHNSEQSTSASEKKQV